jgi:hypothetical protein
MRGFLVVVVVVCAACGGSSGGGDASPSADAPVTPDGGGCAPRVAPATGIPSALDLILAVDTSGSMAEEVAQLEQTLNNVASYLGAASVRANVVVIADASLCIPAPLGSGACPGDEALPDYRHVTQTVGSTNALDLILATHPQWEPSLQADAARAFMVVTDDDADLTAGGFTAQLEALDPRLVGFRFYAIAADQAPDCISCSFNCPGCTNSCCDQAALCTPLAASEGTVYKQLVAATGGVFRNQCEQMFVPHMDAIGQGLIAQAGIACSYTLPADPGGNPIDPAFVNVAHGPVAGPDTPLAYATDAAGCAAVDGWYFDDPAQPTAITLCPDACTMAAMTPGWEVRVAYGCPRS